MLLKNEVIVLTIGDTVFKSFCTDNQPHFVFDASAVEGFYDGVNVKRSEESRPNQWGDFSEPTLLGPRVLTLTGYAKGKNPTELHALRDEFTALLVNDQYVEISVANSVWTRYLTVALTGKPSWIIETDNVARWKLELYAPNPRIYGEERTVQTVAKTDTEGLAFLLEYPLTYTITGDPVPEQFVTNNGNTTAYPVFKVTGDFEAGISLTDNNGKYVTYTGLITYAAPVEIDMGKGTATQNGIDKTVLLSQRDWLTVPAYSTIQPSILPLENGAGWCDIIIRDTWI